MKRLSLLAFLSLAALMLTGCCCGPYYGGCFPYGPTCSPCVTSCDVCNCDPCSCAPCATPCNTGGLFYNMANGGCFGGGYAGAQYVPESCPATAATSSDLSSCGGCGTCNSCNAGCDSCGPVYGPACGPCVPCAPACGPCPLLNIVCLPFAIVERIWNCAPGYWPNTGCSTVYYGDWINDPPCLNDPCSFDSYAGPCSKRACGANACGYDCCGGSSAFGGCATCGGGYDGSMGYMQGGEMIEGEVIPASVGTPTPAPVQAKPTTTAPAANPQASRSGCKNCQKNYQARVSGNPGQMLAAYQAGPRVKTFPTTPVRNGQVVYNNPNNAGQYVRLNNGQVVRVQQPMNQKVQQVSYVQPINTQAVGTAAPRTVAANRGSQSIPQNVLSSLPKGAVIISDEVVSVQTNGNGTAPAYNQANASSQARVAAVAQTGQTTVATAPGQAAASNAAARTQWKAASIKPQTYR